MLKSILATALPEAMVHYLDNYTEEKFSEIYLGEFNTPEAIWNAEMRRMMIEKLAGHIADFTPRLRSNTRAIYQFVPLPKLEFPQLENELFVHIYYLKHLCDSVKFPNWPIKNPVVFLKELLLAWKTECSRKGSGFNKTEALELLGLQPDFFETVESNPEPKIRKAYFKMAQKYHPDKNPEGRDVFEKINAAYEFLNSKSLREMANGPRESNLHLLIKSQVILFSTHHEALNDYKYAGYPMLIKTIQMETALPDLFSKETDLLGPCCELVYYTLRASALNSEELCETGGIETLQGSFSRCVDVISTQSDENDLAVKVGFHIAKCYSAFGKIGKIGKWGFETHEGEFVVF